MRANAPGRSGLGPWARAAMLLAAAAWPSLAVAQQEVTGTTAGGARYRIAVPAVWNGSLVVWSHGLTMEAPGEPPDLGPLAQIQMAEGFAVAATSFRQVGWALFKTVPDTRALVAAFEARFGRPDRVLLHGASLGGLVSAQLLEKGGLGNVPGALLWCAPVAGSRNWDGALDLRLAYDAVCDGVAGAAIPGGAEGLPAGSILSDEEITAAVEACTGVGSARQRRTAEQRRRLRTLLDVAGIHESFLQTDMWYVTRVMADLVHDRRKLRDRVGVGNAGVVYRDPDVDAAIARVVPRAGAARRLTRSYTPSGRIGDASVLALHTDKDDLVVVENLSAYAARVPAGQLVAAVAVEDEPSHCGLSVPEALASWEAFVDWVDGGPAPTPASLQELCGRLALLGLGQGCRIDPQFTIGDLGDRIAPRE